MTAGLLRVGEQLVKLLPAAVARALLVAIVVVAALLHYAATQRINILERRQIEMQATNEHVLLSVQGLTDEVRGYRMDILQQNHELRQANGNGVKH